MGRERTVIFGRDEQWEALDELVRSPDQLGTLLLLRGSEGSGKSALLAEAGRGWRRQAVRVISVLASPRGTFDQLLETTRSLLSQHPDPGLLDSVAAAAQSGSAGQGHLPLVHELTRAIAHLARRRRTVLVVEDADRVDPESYSALSILVQGVRATGGVVVASSEPHAVPDDLLELADRVLDMPPLAEPDIVSLISRWSGRKAVDPTVTSGLRASLGPLYGNPGTLLSTLHALRAEGRLVVVDQHLCLRQAHQPVALADDHELLCAVRRHGTAGERVAASIAKLGNLTIDDLPLVTEAAGVDLRSRGRLIDQLIADRVVRVHEDGQLRPVIPALTAALSRTDDQRVRALPSELAKYLLAQAEQGVAVDSQVLADRLAQADPEVSSPMALDVLIAEADRFARTDPERAADWYRAAVQRLPRSDPRWPRILRTMVRFQLRLGRYQELSDDIRTVVSTLLADPEWTSTDPSDRPHDSGNVLIEVAICWLAALTHEERTDELPDAQRLFDLLSCRSTCDTGMEDFCSTLLRADTSAAVSALNDLLGKRESAQAQPRLAKAVAEVLVLMNSLGCGDEEFQRAWSRWATWTPLTAPDPYLLREAGAVFDRATALELILGEEYGRPPRGPLITYQRIVRAYHAGDWDAALSSARALESCRRTEPDSTTVLLARAFAAEICAARGDLRRAHEWLKDVSDDMPAGHLVSWARAGLRYRGGDMATAVREGWQDYKRHRDAGRLAGLDRLLVRTTLYAHHLGDAEEARAMLGELRVLHERTETRSGREHLLLVTGLLDSTPSLIEQAIELARERGDVFQVLLGCLLVGELVSEPEPWLREAYTLAKQLGSAEGRAAIGEMMRQMGVALPRTRSPRAPFSSTELRIVDLVSDGFTNRQIAMTVRVSEKTVESHLTKLLSRTGCRSRVELAAARLEGKLAGATV